MHGRLDGKDIISELLGHIVFIDMKKTFALKVTLW